MPERNVFAKIVGISAYSQSRAHDTPRLDKESPDEYDERTWREHAHYDLETREVYIPSQALKMAIAEAARRLTIKIPGKRNATYTKNFMSGVLAFEPIWLGVKVDDLQMEKFFANTDGVRGSGKRAYRRYPIIHDWSGTAHLLVIDDEIPKAVFERCLREAGNFVGLGRFRPEKGGYFGRFKVESVAWKDVPLAEAAE